MSEKVYLGVVGQNISYSRSPKIHSEFAKSLGLEKQIFYSLEDVGEKLSFEEKISELKHRNFTGCNITVPYKERAFELADTCSERVKKAGAANVFKFDKAGRIFADNTDGIGLVRDLKINLNFELKNKNILICGAGGAVRGILGSLIQEMQGLGKIVIVNRSIGKAQELIKIFKKDFENIWASSYENLVSPEFNNLIFDLVIDGTSLRNKDKNINLNLPIPENLKLNKNSLVYDLKYCAESETETGFMAWGKNQGAGKVSDGLGMLVEQAAESFKIWTGLMPKTRAVIEGLRVRNVL